MNKNYFVVILLILLLSVFSACKNDPEGIFSGRFLKEENFQNIQKGQRVPMLTYEGTFQALHPDILYDREGLLPHLFYLVMTPYPYSLSAYENPSILVSDNGLLFYEDTYGLNPLVPSPAYGYNDDPDILFNKDDQTFYLYYLETMKPDSQNVILLRSSNGIDWTKKTVIHYNLQQGERFIVSPSVIQIDQWFYMYYVNITHYPYTIEYLKSRDGLSWIKDDVGLVDIKHKRSLPWHLDIFKGSNYFFMLIAGPYEDMNLHLAYSSDGMHWSFKKKPVIENGKKFLFSRRIHRATGFEHNGELVIYFGYTTHHAKSRIGIKKFKLSHLLK